MKTEVLKVNPTNIDPTALKKAANVIKNGDLVAFPTETVYGLGADSLNPLACAKIFQAKNRPLDDPLIVHICDKQDVFRLTDGIHRTTLDLIDEFWPGPLTLLFKKSASVPEIITAGLDTVAIRMPANKIALLLIKEAQTPIAAPSANLFGRPSPTTAQHVLDDLDGKIDLIIDAGKTEIGLESTILDLTQIPFCVLRPGGISIERLRKIIPHIEFYKQDKILSPGMYPRHYSPKAKLILIEGNGKAQVERVYEVAKELEGQGYVSGIMAKKENEDKYIGFRVKFLGPGNDLALCAANLFSVLREFDREGMSIIIAEGVEEQGLGVAIMDRLRKAQGLVNPVRSIVA